MIEALISMGFVPTRPTVNEIIVYTLSLEQEYVTNMERMLQKTRGSYPFADTLIIYCPHFEPGYKGWYFLLVRNPSPELIDSIQPSPEPLKDKERYIQLEKYTTDEIYDMIKNMKEIKKWNFAQIAETLGIHIYDVTMWLSYKDLEKSLKEEEERMKEGF
jgi:hypothetical protein